LPQPPATSAVPAMLIMIISGEQTRRSMGRRRVRRG
jgi:hypothetical protein